MFDLTVFEIRKRHLLIQFGYCIHVLAHSQWYWPFPEDWIFLPGEHIRDFDDSFDDHNN